MQPEEHPACQLLAKFCLKYNSRNLRETSQLFAKKPIFSFNYLRPSQNEEKEECFNLLSIKKLLVDDWTKTENSKLSLTEFVNYTELPECKVIALLKFIIQQKRGAFYFIVLKGELIGRREAESWKIKELKFTPHYNPPEI